MDSDKDKQKRLKPRWVRRGRPKAQGTPAPEGPTRAGESVPRPAPQESAARPALPSMKQVGRRIRVRPTRPSEAEDAPRKSPPEPAGHAPAPAPADAPRNDAPRHRPGPRNRWRRKPGRDGAPVQAQGELPLVPRAPEAEAAQAPQAPQARRGQHPRRNQQQKGRGAHVGQQPRQPAQPRPGQRPGPSRPGQGRQPAQGQKAGRPQGRQGRPQRSGSQLRQGQRVRQGRHQYRRDDSSYLAPAPRKVEDGIRARSQDGKFAHSWWADRWIEVLERFGWTNRLQRGMNYARQGQVIDFHLATGRVTARVQGTRAEPYDVVIEMEPIADGEWLKVVEKMASQAAFSAKLLSGEMPWNIEDAFADAGVNLLPVTARDLKTKCTCPDSANPCKHIAAVYYILAEEFDREPFMIFRLRGRTREGITNELRVARSMEALPPGSIEESQSTGECTRKGPARGGAHRLEEATREEALSFYPDRGTEEDGALEDHLDDYYQCGPQIEGFAVQILAPRIRGGLLKRLGVPAFWDSEMEFMAEMEKLYALIGNSAMENALGKQENS